MSNHLISLAYKRDLRTSMRKAVLVLMADKASDDGSGIWAAKQTMADELCCSKQTVIDTIKAFVAEGIVSEAGQRKSPNGYTVEYAINIAAVEALALVGCHADKGSRKLTGQSAGPVKQTDATSQPAGPEPSLNPLPLMVSNETTPPIEIEEFKGIKPEHVLEAWNAMAEKAGVPKAKMTPERRKKLGTFVRRNSIDDITEAIWAVPKSAFLCGENDRGWKANLDFMLRPANLTKITEGVYGS